MTMDEKKKFEMWRWNCGYITEDVKGIFWECWQAAQDAVTRSAGDGEYSGLSWSGHNIRGDRDSVEAVKSAIHQAGTVPELKDEIAELRKRIAGAALAPAALSGSDIARIYHEATGQHLRSQDEYLAFAFTRAILAAALPAEAMRIAGEGREPVAWHIGNADGSINKIGAVYIRRSLAEKHIESYGGELDAQIVPLYAAPPESRQRVASGATDEQRVEAAKAMNEVYLGFPPQREPGDLDLRAVDAVIRSLAAMSASKEGSANA